MKGFILLRTSYKLTGSTVSYDLSYCFFRTFSYVGCLTLAVPHCAL